MKKLSVRVLVPAFFVASALALAVASTAQAPPPAGSPPAAQSPQMAPMPGHHHVVSTQAGEHDASMKAECQAMMAKKQAMQEKFQAMDARLDGLVAEMNAAQGSKEVDAMEKPMAAVLNELVAQRKAFRAMQMEMQPAMMAHMMHHMHGMKGEMECPMMKKGSAPEPQVEGTKPMSMR